MKTINELKNAALRQAIQHVKQRAHTIAGEQTRVIIYGSYARGEERDDSDVDLLIVLPDDRSDHATEERIRDSAIEMGLEYDFLFSVIVVSEKQMKQFQGFKVFNAIEAEGVPA